MTSLPEGDERIVQPFLSKYDIKFFDGSTYGAAELFAKELIEALTTIRHEEAQKREEAVREIRKRLSQYTEHSHRCFLFTADADEYDHAKCDCGLTEALTPRDTV